MSKTDSPIGGDVKVVGVEQSDYYNEDEGNFGTRKLTKVATGDEVTANDVGMVVDLLNEFDAEAIRETMLQRSGDSQ